jgi:hypothetical protein
MPSLLDKLAAPGCPNIGHGWGRCHVHYVEPIENHPSHPNSFTSSRLNLIQPELGRRRCYGRFRVRGLDLPEYLALAAKQSDAPPATHAAGELGGCVFRGAAAGRHAPKIGMRVAGVESVRAVTTRTLTSHQP